MPFGVRADCSMIRRESSSYHRGSVIRPADSLARVIETISDTRMPPT